MRLFFPSAPSARKAPPPCGAAAFGAQAATRPPRGGFTLLEIVMALAITSILLAAASSFLYALASIWLKAERNPGLEHHYLGVTSFLNYVLTQAESPEALKTNTADNAKSGNRSGQADNAAARQSQEESAAADKLNTQVGNIRWSDYPGNSMEPCLNFKLREQLPVFVCEEPVMPEAECWLWLDKDEGLYLLWQTEAQKRDDSTNFNKTLLSRLVTKITYSYYDSTTESWEEDEDPPSETSASGSVKGVNFYFDLEGEEKVFRLLFPGANTALPLIY